MRPHLESGFLLSPSWEAGDCSHPPPMAHRDYAGNIRSPHDDTPLCHQWQVILHTSDIVGRFDAFYRPSHSVSYQIYTGFYCVLFSLHTQLFILGFLLLLTLQDLCMTVTKPKQSTVKRDLWLCLMGFVY